MCGAPIQAEAVPRWPCQPGAFRTMVFANRNGKHPIMATRRDVSRRQFCAMALSTVATGATTVIAKADAPPCGIGSTQPAKALASLKAAYPAFIAAWDQSSLVWSDGFRMPLSLFPHGRSSDDEIRRPDLAAQLRQAYPKGPCGIPLDPSADPGRIRYAPFFARMYGANEAAVGANIVDVPWPARRRGTAIRLSRVNGASDALARVAAELSRLPRRFHRFFDNPAGGFYWRNIAGTDRLSGHAFGIAIDINVNLSDYWRNELHGIPGEPEGWQSLRPRNRIPFDIVDIFERHGFIWGGKWYHYDTMHFEYRPEFFV